MINSDHDDNPVVSQLKSTIDELKTDSRTLQTKIKQLEKSAALKRAAEAHGFANCEHAARLIENNVFLDEFSGQYVGQFGQSLSQLYDELLARNPYMKSDFQEQPQQSLTATPPPVVAVEPPKPAYYLPPVLSLETVIASGVVIGTPPAMGHVKRGNGPLYVSQADFGKYQHVSEELRTVDPKKMVRDEHLANKVMSENPVAFRVLQALAFGEIRRA